MTGGQDHAAEVMTNTCKTLDDGIEKSHQLSILNTSDLFCERHSSSKKAQGVQDDQLSSQKKISLSLVVKIVCVLRL